MATRELENQIITCEPIVGMDAKANPAALQQNLVRRAINCRVTRLGLETRNGLAVFGPTLIDSTRRTMGLYFYNYRATNPNPTVIRFAQDVGGGINTLSHYGSGSSSWTAISAGTGGSIDTLGNVARPKFLQSGISRYLAVAGYQPIQVITLAPTNQYVPLGDSPAVIYIENFGRRIVGASKLDSPVYIAWSGINNPSVWNAATDQTAGNDLLDLSGDDFSNPITGLTAFDSILVIMRERSIWQAQITQSSTRPFYFTELVSGIGCDAPHTVCKVPNGVIWYNIEQDQFFFLEIGTNVAQPIGDTVKDVLKVTNIKTDDNPFITKLSNANLLQASYNPQFNCYTLIAPAVDEAEDLDTLGLTLHLTTKQWSIDYYRNIYTILDAKFPNGELYSNRLCGPGVSQGTKLFASSDGSQSVLSDANPPALGTPGFESKLHVLPEAQYITEVKLHYYIDSIKSGNNWLGKTVGVTLRVDADPTAKYLEAGITNTHTIVADDLDKRMTLSFKCNIYTDRFKILADVTPDILVGFIFLGYDVYYQTGGVIPQTV